MNEHGLAIVIFTASGTEIETDGKKIPRGVRSDKKDGSGGVCTGFCGAASVSVVR